MSILFFLYHLIHLIIHTIDPGTIAIDPNANVYVDEPYMIEIQDIDSTMQILDMLSSNETYNSFALETPDSIYLKKTLNECILQFGQPTKILPQNGSDVSYWIKYPDKPHGEILHDLFIDGVDSNARLHAYWYKPDAKHKHFFINFVVIGEEIYAYHSYSIDSTYNLRTGE